MSEVELTERLDQAIEAMLRNPQGVSPDVLEPTISELLGVAVELRHLPRADFKARLKDELEKETLMSTKAQSTQSIESAQSKIREGFRTVTPYLVVQRCESLRELDRKSTRLNSSHVAISYAVFCLKKKKKKEQ